MCPESDRIQNTSYEMKTNEKLDMGRIEYGIIMMLLSMIYTFILYLVMIAGQTIFVAFQVMKPFKTL